MSEGSVQNLMTETRVFNPSQEFVEKARVCSREQRDELYRKSVERSNEFWAEMAEANIEPPVGHFVAD